MKLTGFDGQTAFVTGAAGGIGRALVALLADAGARVVATDTADALAGLGPADPVRPLARWHALDVRDHEAVSAAAADAAATLAVHAAGALSIGPLLTLPPAEWRRISEINVTGTLNVLQALGAVMAPQGRGAIVVIGSNAGGVPRTGIGAYGATKAAVAMLTRCAGLELAPRGVRCNLIAPGSTLTPMQTGMWANPDAGAAGVIAGDAAQFRTGIPLGKLATPQDIAQAAMFLLSDQAGHVTMADLYVDGGATLRA